MRGKKKKRLLQDSSSKTCFCGNKELLQKKFHANNVMSIGKG